MKKMIIMSVMIVLASTIAVAEMNYRSETNMKVYDGSGRVTHKVNNKSVNITVEDQEEAEVHTEITESNLSYTVNASGNGSVKNEISHGDYQVNTTSESRNKTYKGSGSFEKVFSFVENIFISGFVRFQSMF